MKQFVDKTIAITGAASGMGLEMTKALLAVGARVAASDVNQVGLAELGKLAGPQQLTITALDVSDQTAVLGWAEATVQHFGAVDGIINNAGVSMSCLATDQPREHFEWLMNINFWGVINGCEAFLPYLQQRDQAWIVNLSSLFGLMAVPSQSAYNAAKFAVRGYSESLRQDLMDSHIHVLTVHPGGIRTNIARNGRHWHSPNGESTTTEQAAAQFDTLARTRADDAAKQIIRAMARKKRRLLIGADAKILDVMQRLFPAGYDLIARPFYQRRGGANGAVAAKKA